MNKIRKYLTMADFAGLDNVPNRASNQTGTLQFMAINRELFSTSLYGCAFVMVIINDGQTSKKART